MLHSHDLLHSRKVFYIETTNTGAYQIYINRILIYITITWYLILLSITLDQKFLNEKFRVLDEWFIVSVKRHVLRYCTVTFQIVFLVKEAGVFEEKPQIFGRKLWWLESSAHVPAGFELTTSGLTGYWYSSWATKAPGCYCMDQQLNGIKCYQCLSSHQSAISKWYCYPNNILITTDIDLITTH